MWPRMKTKTTHGSFSADHLRRPLPRTGEQREELNLKQILQAATTRTARQWEDAKATKHGLALWLFHYNTSRETTLCSSFLTLWSYKERKERETEKEISHWRSKRNESVQGRAEKQIRSVLKVPTSVANEEESSRLWTSRPFQPQQQLRLKRTVWKQGFGSFLSSLCRAHFSIWMWFAFLKCFPRLSRFTPLFTA